MVAITRISNASAVAAINTVTALLNVGGAGSIEIRSGVQPVDVSVAATGTVLAVLPLSVPAFAPATDQAGYARAVANNITTDVSADASGTATWFRAYDGNGVGVLDGNAGLVDESLVLDSVDIALNDTVIIGTWHLIQSET